MPNKQKWTMHHAQNIAIRISLIIIIIIIVELTSNYTIE